MLYLHVFSFRYLVTDLYLPLDWCVSALYLPLYIYLYEYINQYLISSTSFVFIKINFLLSFVPVIQGVFLRRGFFAKFVLRLSGIANFLMNWRHMASTSKLSLCTRIIMMKNIWNQVKFWLLSQDRVFCLLLTGL